MSVIVTEVYEASIDAGVTEEKARAAAVILFGEQLSTQNDIGEVRAEVAETKAEMETRLTRLEASLETRFAAARAESANEFKTLYPKSPTDGREHRHGDCRPRQAPPLTLIEAMGRPGRLPNLCKGADKTS